MKSKKSKAFYTISIITIVITCLIIFNTKSKNTPIEKDFYFVKLYKDKTTEDGYIFNRIEVSEYLDDGFVNIKDFYKKQNDKVYTTIPINMNIIVCDYSFNVEILDKDKLSNLLSVQPELNLDPIKKRIWLNIRNKKLTEKRINKTNKDLKEVGLKITSYKKL